MLMGKVVGHIVSTRKNEKLIGSKILEVRLIENEQDTDKFLIALDS
ncbi:MAG: ethanolamine utilization protein EutN, partial [Clostridia bacterium]|nr:ethanolamine utilization protein EutN [Clostridia bacterium]